MFGAHAHIGGDVDMVTLSVSGSGHYMGIPMEGEWLPVDSDSRDNIIGGFQHEYEGRL